MNTFFPIYSVSKSLLHHDYSQSFSPLLWFLLSLFPSLDCQNGLRSVSLAVFCQLLLGAITFYLQPSLLFLLL